MDTKDLELNEYCDRLQDVKHHLDESFQNINIRYIKIQVCHPEANTEMFQKRLKEIMKYCNSHDRDVEVDYR